MIDTVRQDLRFAFRLFRHRPGFTLLTVLTLALGIGATTAVYTIVHAVLLRSPYRDANRIVVIWDNNSRDGDQIRQILASQADFDAYRSSAQFIDHISTVGRARPVLHHGSVNQERLAGVVTSSLFRETLGVEAVLGRVFTTDDESGGCAVVLAYGFWNTILGGDKLLVGRSLTLDNAACTVLGVMAPEFTIFPNTADMWFLAGHASTPGNGPLFGMVSARLKPNATIQQVRAEVAALHKAANADRPAGGDAVPGLTPAVDYIQRELTTLSSPTLRASLMLTFGAVSLLLLIACLSVANLMLARLSERQRELVVRAALGSGRMRLVRQLLVEGFLLTLGGTGLGLAMALAAIRGFRYLNPVALPPHAGAIPVDLNVLLFAVLLSVATTLAFGLVPALQASRIDLTQSLKGAGRGFLGRAAGRRSAQSIVAVQISVSFVLLTGAALLMTSVLHLDFEPLGFDPNGVITLGVKLPTPRYADAKERDRFQVALLEKIRALPGVDSAALGWAPPWDPQDNIVEEQIEFQGQATSAGGKVENAVASPGLFEVLKTPLLEGRFFDEHDMGKVPTVAIVSQRLVDEHFAGRDPLGQQIRFVDGKDHSQWLTIVGVVGSWKHLVRDSNWRDTPLVFRAGAGFPITVRASGDLRRLAREMQKHGAELDSSVEFTPELLSDRLSKVLLYPSFRATLLMSFALGALLLAAVGLHGVLAQLVSQRTPEFGVRRAVGAQTVDLLWLVARQGGFPVLTGLTVGLACSLAFSRLLANLLYRIQPADPVMLGAVSMTLVVVSALAIALPARRAASVDPMVALRDE